MIQVSKLLRAVYASYLSLDSLKSELFDKYGLSIDMNPSVENKEFILRSILNILRPVPVSLIKNCRITQMIVKDMGPNRPFYPNHGYYIGNQIALNANIFLDPDMSEDFIDNKGYFISRPQETLLHEYGHALDAAYDNLSLKPDWLALSGWSEEYKPGLKRLVIKEKGVPPVVGEWFYDPKAGFTRFYAKRNPWDDFADSFAYYLAPLLNKMPLPKRDYFKKLFQVYN